MTDLSAASKPARQGRAWGKVILLGEHAVVYGVPALAVGIDRGARATTTPSSGSLDRKSRLEVPCWSVSVTEGDVATDLGRAFTAVLDASRGARVPLARDAHVTVSAHTDLPPGGGLGCSAALGVAIVRALLPAADADEAAAVAMAWERVFHGNPSGIDAAVSASGGSILFQKGQPMERVPLAAPLTVCLGSTGVPSSTKAMVDGVARRREREPEAVAAEFATIGAIVRDGRRALEHGDAVALGKLMNDNHQVLQRLALSTPVIERLCELANDSGALGSKLTGAGGGGCVVALAPGDDEAAAIVRAWKVSGFNGFVAKVDAREGAS